MNRHQMLILETETFECTSKTMFSKTKTHSLGFMKSTSHQSPGYCLIITRANRGDSIWGPSVLGYLGCRDRHPAGAQRAACSLQPHHPNRWNRESSQPLQHILSSTWSRKLPPAAGGHSWTQTTPVCDRLTANKLLVFSELCLCTLLNTFL